MKAICVTPERALALRDIPAPNQPAPDHVLIDIEASAINHGDKIFLRMPAAAGNALAASQHDVWGVSAAGRVVAAGAGVPARYTGKRVAVYRSLNRSPDNIGLWCETAQVPYTSCLILPDDVGALDYSGSLVNVITAYAFLETIAEAGHRGVIATAGNSATGLALAALARQRGMPVILLVRNQATQADLLRQRAQYVLVTTEEDFADTLSKLSTELGATAVFDGVGGGLTSQIAAHLPIRSAIYIYGTMGGPGALTVSAPLFLMKDLSMQRFSNFESRTVREPEKLTAALSALESVIADPVFRTRAGRVFCFDQIEEAMAFEAADGGKAILVP
ncbi:alcohol dehydrogenase catalytic domain-containing protein [Paraburkholderia silvatlantica]|uniref:GroES-like protein n=2 Tax=cellular organisms TaxID=131567 RepID=W2TZV9_NECAM|nr:alcohol dehydrogenase catalytic domain-containing protein [Paraburkholderia silvatlantica]XP_013308843.1 GroES-like protein [Necator americanus]ETN86616.1 GroES-like protein [Necator americanus]MBB2931270.1 NADPH:quinone reductase-like Zn-dependent oxidoreductase [Paraburkholderia silvatlantica]PVY28292.1 NADPH:quinone reductase-like Zn-dependent oxidoreductase [Paraburkholderia silvatlantica]PXW34977.1 NADPH:quinone reductase-like Zn-dependent oxidoreductase [Paraburkholderia silvatlantica